MTLLEKRIKGLTEDLSEAVSKLSDEVTPKNVHWLRTTIRRIESLVSYAHPCLGKKLERSLENLTALRKRAGKVRDLDVQTKLLDQLANGSTARDRKILADLLQKKRERQAGRLASSLQKLAGAKFFSRMDRIAEKAGTGASGPDRPLAPLEEARLQLARLADDFSSRQPLKPSRLHETRIRLKTIRYLAELADESPEQKTFIDGLKAVQDAVGEWHDWEELTKLAEKRFSDRVNCALLREVRALFAAHHSSALSAVNNLFSSGVMVTARKPPRAAQSVRSLARRA
jgi:CHAD domain-containing protein